MDNKDRLKQRGSWGTWFEFLFAYVGSLVGYGNVWRFPYVCYRNGGGAFLLPFIISLVIGGIPITLLEMMCGQYSGFGPTRVWEVCPLFKGIGFTMVTVVSIVSVYYTMIMAWTAYFLVSSFQDPLPWSTCDNEWNSQTCYTPFNQTLRNDVSNLSESRLALNSSNNTTWSTPSEEFWLHKALGISSGIDDIGPIRWDLVLCLLLAWAASWLCLIKSIHSMGKVAYVAASLPYVILTCLLIRGCLLPGSTHGLLYFLVPRWHLLGSLTVWRDAAVQVAYSSGVGGGAISTLSSYNKFHNDCFRDTIIMPVLDAITSIFAGLVIFAYLGYAAHLSNKDIDQVVSQGPGLIFIAYPAALATLPLPQLWSVLFFAMLLVMGLDSQYVHLEIIATGVVDLFPKLLSKKLVITTVVCVVSFLAGLPMTTTGGSYILNLVDWYVASICYMLVTSAECIVLALFYGTDRLFSDLEHMTGRQIPRVFKYAWRYITPCFTMCLWVTGFIFFKPISTRLQGYNMTSDICGLILGCIPLVPLPAFAIWQLWGQKGTISTRIKQSLKPTPLWRPAIYKEVERDNKDNETDVIV